MLDVRRQKRLRLRDELEARENGRWMGVEPRGTYRLRTSWSYC